MVNVAVTPVTSVGAVLPPATHVSASVSASASATLSRCFAPVHRSYQPRCTSKYLVPATWLVTTCDAKEVSQKRPEALGPWNLQGHRSVPPGQGRQETGPCTQMLARARSGACGPCSS